MGSAALAPPQAVDVTLALFAGTKLDITPSDCPEGISPDTQDGIYLPGGWMSRPGLARLYDTGELTAGASVLYEKTYIQPNNDPLTLILTSDGQLWVEDVNNSPGELNSIFQVEPAALYAQSVTADGREYMAFSDLIHGQGVPLQFDGTFLDRVTQDGPGQSPTVADLQTSIVITSTTLDFASSPIDYLMPVSSISETGNICTIDFLSDHNFVPNANIIVFGAPAGYNGEFTVLSTTATTISYFNETTGLGSGSGGLVNIALALCVTSAPHGLQNGDYCVIAGASPASGGFNPNNGVAGASFAGTVDTDSTGFIVSWVSGTQFTQGLAGGQITINGVLATIASVTGPTSLNLVAPVVANQSGVAYAASILNPEFWQVVEVTGADSFLINIATASQIVTAEAGATGGHLNAGGQSSTGVHQVVCMFLTRNGALTQPSPPIAFQSAGNSKWSITNLPIGPANVVARVLGFTGAGGDDFFIIPASVVLPNPTGLLGAPITVQSTVVPDNTSTTYTMDVPDNTLFDAIAIDQVGNDLFDQRVLGPVLGFFSYASRLMCWGDYDKVENLLNMGFCGGFLSGVLTTPLGWKVLTAGGLLENAGPWSAGMVWQITGDGSANPKGQISQPAWQDAYGDPILQPNTEYLLRLWGQNPNSTMDGFVRVDLTSASIGLLAFAVIPVTAFSTVGNFATTSFGKLFPIVGFVPLATPPTIPDDAVFVLYDIGTDAGAVILHGEVELVYSQNPYNNVLVRASYAENPEGFAQTTGNLGAADDDSAVQCLALLRKPALLETLEGIHIFQDNGGEPGTWEVDSLTRAVGAVSLRGGDPGKFGTGDAAEDWAVIASKNGVYLFAGGEFWKVSQEISRGTLPQAEDPRPTWDDINWGAQQTIVAKNDPSARRAYFAVPISGAVYANGAWNYSAGAVATTPNAIFVLDYREMDTAQQIASSPPVHITIQGKMKSSDLTRKWSTWNISANDMEILIRPGNQRELFFAGGVRNGAAYGNVYSLDPANLTDDDYGQIFPYYTTYAFTDHDQEQALGLGSDLHLYKHIHAFITGVGQVMITPIRNSLYNFQPSLSPRALTPDTDSSNYQANDLEWSGLTLRGQRVFFRVWVQPFPGATDVQIRLQKFIAGMMKDPVVQFRQSGV
jgi:hypothetical protein